MVITVDDFLHGDTVIRTVSDSDQTWYEMIPYFLDCLRGHGFIIDKEVARVIEDAIDDWMERKAAEQEIQDNLSCGEEEDGETEED
jgi:hypothetical protein